MTGPGRGAKELQAGDVQTKDTIATFGGLRMVVSGSVAYMQSERQLAAFDRGRYLGLSRPQAELKRARAAVQKSLDKMQSDQPEAEEARRQIAGPECPDPPLRRADEGLLSLDRAVRPSVLDDRGGRGPVRGRRERGRGRRHREGQRGLDGRGRGKGVGIVRRRRRAVREHGYRTHPLLPALGSGEPKMVAEEIRPRPYPQDDLTRRYEDAAHRHPASHVSASKGLLSYSGLRGGPPGLRIGPSAANSRSSRLSRMPAAADKARRLLDAAGLSGRVAVHHVPRGRLPYTSYFANLVVSDGMLRGRPYPDTRESSPGAASVRRRCWPWPPRRMRSSERRMREWGQAISPEVAGGRRASGLVVGRLSPGAHSTARGSGRTCTASPATAPAAATRLIERPAHRAVVRRARAARHDRPASPQRLAAGQGWAAVRAGRLRGLCRRCVQRHAPLWRIDVPDSRRLGAFLDCGSMAVDDRAALCRGGGQVPNL